MSESRDTKFGLIALGLVVLVLFLGLALLTHRADDPAVELANPLNQFYQMDWLTYPAAETTRNACGRLGSLVSAMMLDGLGYGAYYLVFSLAVVTGLLVLRREIDSLLLRAIGWTASLIGFVTVLAMLLPWSAPGTVMGAGGHLGALGAGLLEFHFARVGGLILAISLVMGGLLLSTDYVVLRFALFAGTLLIALTARGRGRWPKRRSGRRAKQRTAESLSVRIRGKRVGGVDGMEDEEHELDDDELYEDEESEDEVADSEIEDDDSEEADDGRDADDEDEEHAADQADAGAAVGLHRGATRRRRLAALRVRRPPESEDRDEVMNRLDEAAEREESFDYELPSMELLLESDQFSFEEQDKEVRRKAKILEKTFASFGFDVKVVEIETGPVIAQYEVQLEAGLRLSKITGLADDLAIALRVPSVRIVAPIPGKNTVGIEVPNEERQLVRLREVMEETNGRVKKMRIPLFLGKDVSGTPLTVDLSTLPHLLIAGRTGTGKSVCLNAIIASILMTRGPDEVRMLMIDPKMVELSGYRSLPHLMHPVVTDMRKAEAILAWAVEKMEERYELLARAGVRHVSVYNQLGEEELLDRLEPDDEEQRQAIPLHMPYIVIVADEMADLMMTSGKEVEQHIIRLAQKSRAVGIHLILATQKPTVDVITGLIKSNLPARIAFQVASRTDSRVVLDEMGADRLLGNGDMLFLWPGTSTLLRGQGTYLTDDEITAIVESCGTMEQNFVKELVQLKVDDGGGDADPGPLKKRDDLYENAVEIVIREGRGSVSLLQRSLGIGYGRAARLIDFMAEDGIVGPYAGSQAREVTITLDDWHRMQGSQPGAEPAPVAARPQPSNRVLPDMISDDDGSADEEMEAPDTGDDVDDWGTPAESAGGEERFEARHDGHSQAVIDGPVSHDTEGGEDGPTDDVQDHEDDGEEEEEEYEYVEDDGSNEEYADDEYEYEEVEYDDDEYILDESA
jgi:S-DNA-T family DNA segregation ATPase FtsK/SpoIIIE